jgi:hypothetical protein
MSSAKVNRPTNVKVKEEDVNRKLQLYGIFSGKLLSLRMHVDETDNPPSQLSKSARSHL